MKVAVLMGSDSDWPILKPAVELLKHFGIEPVVKVASAHRTPSIVRDFVMEADHDKEFAAFIVAAGAAAHLAGVVASYTIKPVIGVPVNATPLNGMDALLSTVQMPSGVPVASMAVRRMRRSLRRRSSPYTILPSPKHLWTIGKRWCWRSRRRQIASRHSFNKFFYCLRRKAG